MGINILFIDDFNGGFETTTTLTTIEILASVMGCINLYF